MANCAWVKGSLSESAELYRLLVCNMQSGVAYCRVLFEGGKPIDFVYLMVNRAFTAQIGSDDVVGKKGTEVSKGLEAGDPEIFERYAQVALTGQPDCLELFSESLKKWFQVSLSSNKPEHFVAILDDITEHKRMLATLEDKEQLLRLFIESAPAAIAMLDKEMRYLAASKRFIEDYHLAEDNLIGRNHYEIFPDVSERWREFHRRCLAGETIRMDEDSFVRADGSVEWVRWEIKPWYSGDAMGGMLIFSEVITENKKTEQESAKLSEQLQLALDAANLGWWCYDPVAEVIFFDKRQERILGLFSQRQTREEILNRIHPDDRENVWRKVAAALNPADPRPYEAEYRYFMPDHSVRWLKAYGMATFKGEGHDRQATSLVGTVGDITASKKDEEALRLAAAVYEDSSEAMMVLDENRNIIMVNHAFADITGYEAADVIGQHPRFLRIDHQDEALRKEDDDFYQNLWRQADESGRFKGEIWLKRKDGQFIALQITVNVITGEAGMPRRYVMLLSDITEKKRSDDLIWNQANFDTLTGLANRRFFRDRLEHEVRNARRSNLPLALMFIDLDGFKDVNDTLGHDMGDLLLKEAAERLYRCVRESDTVARQGGDEFTIILTELHDPGNADQVARHILKALSEPVTLGKEQAYVSASIGITLYPNDAVEVEDLIRNADQAMYEAKQRGKNQYQYFTPAMQKAAMKRMRMVNDLRKALERNQFEIMYQPIVDLATGEVRKAEALIRWRHPKRGLVNPIEFISAAEDTGLIISFGDWMFHEAARQAALCRAKYRPDFQISVNISPVQFKKGGIDPSVWLEYLKDLGLPGQGIVIEITEGLLLDASTKVIDQLLMLRDAGIEVALDDFGTGYSSLAYLKKFDIDYLKIDQAFIHNLETDSDDMALCEAIIVMAHKLGLKVIAEGIETDSQRRLLAEAGCDFAQGYLFSKPMMAEQFERLVECPPVTPPRTTDSQFRVRF